MKNCAFAPLFRQSAERGAARTAKRRGEEDGKDEKFATCMRFDVIFAQKCAADRALSPQALRGALFAQERLKAVLRASLRPRRRERSRKRATEFRPSNAIASFCINPFFACTARAIAAIGTNAIRLTAAAVFCGTSASNVIKGISSVPPPSPMPPSTPPANPMAMRTAVFTARV